MTPNARVGAQAEILLCLAEKPKYLNWQLSEHLIVGF